MTDSTYDDLASGIRGRSRARIWYLFLALVATASTLPFLALPLAQHAIVDTGSALNIVAALTFVGANFHVAATAWFYTDTSMGVHLRANPWRYFFVPGLLIGGGALLFQFATPAVRSAALGAFFCWQLWHYQKQNVGLLSFIAAGTDGVSVSAWERRTLALAAIAGIAGFFSLYSIGLRDLSPLFGFAHRAGGFVYLLVPVAFCIALVKSPALRRNPLRVTCLAFGALFFLPTFLFGDWISATLSYAVAHGLQYLVFMGFVSVGRPNPIASLVMLVALATLGALALNAAVLAPDWSDVPYGFALYGAFLGTVMAHFVMDSGLWRLREPFQRKYMREKFYFVFDR